MPPRAFTLEIPADAKFAEVAADAARKYVELMGGAEAEGTAFADALVEAVRQAAGPGVPLTCAFCLQSSGVEVVVTGGASPTSIVRQPIAAVRR